MDCNGGNTKTLISEDKFYKIIDMHDADEKRLKPMTQITIDSHQYEENMNLEKRSHDEQRYNDFEMKSQIEETKKQSNCIVLAIDENLENDDGKFS